MGLMRYDIKMETKQSMYNYLRSGISDPKGAKIHYMGRTLNGGQLFDSVASVASYLLSIGVKQGESVGVILPNIPEAVIALYAINAVGAIANLIHPKLSGVMIDAFLKKTDTRVVFVFDKTLRANLWTFKGKKRISCCASGYLPVLKKLLFIFKKPFSRLLNIVGFAKVARTPAVALPQTDCYAPAVYIHSGGTTGEPKTVSLSSYALNHSSEAIMASVYQTGDAYNGEDVMLAALPIFHGFGLAVCIHASLAHFQIAMLPRFQAKVANKIIKKCGVTHIAGVPTMFRKLLAEKDFGGEYLGKVKRVFCGGDSLNPKLKQEFDMRLRSFGSNAEIQEGYGLSETASVFAVSLQGETLPNCQGKPLLGNSIKVLDKHGNAASAGENGEFYLRTESMMLGYLNDEAATAEVLKRDEEGKVWLKTGDLGHIDGNGNIFFCEREKRSIKIAAFNIFPSEVEALVEREISEVKECLVARCTNTARPYTKMYVVMGEDRTLNGFVEQKIKRAIARQMIKYAIPKQIIAVNQLAKTPLGKNDFKKYEE